MEDSKSKKGGREGVGAPAKGDSSAPFDPNDGATISDAPATPPPPARPASRVAPTPPPAATADGATISDVPVTPPPPAKPPTRVAPPPNPDATISDSLPATPVSSGSGGRPLSGLYMKEAILQPGDLIGARYEIVALLGEGGMGAVYKALDREVERTVALKLIRPELASNPAILARFKQELLTAHQVTHKNVIRIYDIAEADGVKFITMEFVEGDDLRRILTDAGKLPTERAVEIIRQVCLALDAAHSAGIIHRDLKPQNIMQEAKTGRILVMDFGLARTIGGDGMTQTGALLGTIEYMSPEQSMGKTLDQRSDIFAVGLIFYELLIGKTPYKADTAMASLLRRNQERAVPAAELDASVPKALSDIVSKCLERDLEHRYQNVQEILHDLDAFQGARPTLASISLPIPVPVAPAKPAVPWKWIGIGTLAVAVVGGGWALRSGVLHSGSSGGTAEVKGPELSLAILPFQNASGDASQDALGANLADMLSTAVGQSAHLRIVSPDRMHQIFSDLRITPGTPIDPSMVANIAKFSNADTVVSGKFMKFGEQIRIEARVQDLKQGKDVPLKIDAASEKDVFKSVDQLADLIRQNLAISSDVQKELKASSYQPSSKSPAALSAYMQGVQLRRQGKNLEAVKMFQSAVQQDPEFALAYSRLAETSSALGYDSQAEQASRKALELDSQLPLAEKYLIEANHARVMKDNKKALEAYEKLAASLPGDNDVQFTLGNLYLDTSDFDKARAQYAKVLKNDPKNLTALLQTGWLEVQNGKPQAGLDPLNRALSLAIEVGNEEQEAQILQVLGIAYDGMNRYDEALRNVQQSLEINKRLGNKSAAANSYSEIGDIQSYLGKPDLSLAAYNEALKLRTEIGAKKDVASTLISLGSLWEDRGDYDKALSLYKEALQTERDAGDAALQAVCLNNIGSVYLAKGQSEDALTYYQQALQLREKLNNAGDTADTLHDLGEAYTRTAQYDQAMSSFMRALELRRTTNDAHNTALTQHSMGMVFLNQGRFGAAVSNLSESVQGFRAAKDQSRIMAQVLIDYADALGRAGRSGEVGKTLEEAQSLAVQLKNDKLIADVHDAQGDIAFFGGDTKAAREQYQQALQLAQRAKSPETVLVAKLNLARVNIAEGRSAAAVNDLRSISQEADRQGLKYLALVSSVELGTAMINSKDYAHAKEVLDQALNTSEKLGVRLQTAIIHYQQGNLLKQAGDAAGAASQYKQAVGILDEIKKEQGAEHTLERADLKTIYAQATQGAGTAS
jgi:eukaryotic-like serine/threonine-protein kinase